MLHQNHRLQSSGWMAHQHVTGNISTGGDPKSSRLGGSSIQKVLKYLCGLLIVLVIYTLCGASALQSVKLQGSIGDVAVGDITLESAI